MVTESIGHLTRRGPRAALALLVAAALLLAPTAARAQDAAATASADTCAISIQGSDTMVILGQKWAQAFMARHPGVNISVTGGGSGTGMAALLNDTCALAQSSRPMKAKEKVEFTKKFKTTPLEVRVALDGLAIFVHESNPIESLTVEQLRGIYSGKVTNFKEVGGPDRKITVYGRENNSGTYVAFKDMVLEGGDFAATVNVLAGTAAVINALTKDPSGIGYGGIAYGHGIRLLGVDLGKGEGPVMPTEADVDSGRYPLARPLYFYINPKRLSVCLVNFATWVLSAEGQSLIAEVGYFPLPEAALGESRATVSDAGAPVLARVGE